MQAYWRERGYSGEIVETAQGAISIVYDATSEQGHPALVVFIGGDQATAWGDKPVCLWKITITVYQHM